MKIAVGIPAFNEEMFVEQSVKNCIDVGYDYVIYLDDGSTDSTYDKLLYFTKEYPHIKILRNKNNSVLFDKGNRWEMVAKECGAFNPDWIFVRAMDEVLSYSAHKSSQGLLHKNLEYIDSTGVNMLVFPYIDLWRSEWWYRADGHWSNRSPICAWKNNTGWAFSYGSGIHLGGHKPNYMAVKDISSNINLDGQKDIVVLHYGMSSYELLCKKFEYQVKTAKTITTRAVGIPTNMPHPNSWRHYNGYKAVDERAMVLKKVKQCWFKDRIPNVQQPKFKSLYKIVAKYDKYLAEEYAKIYGE